MNKVERKLADEVRPENKRSDFDRLSRGRSLNRIKRETVIAVIER